MNVSIVGTLHTSDINRVIEPEALNGLSVPASEPFLERSSRGFRGFKAVGQCLGALLMCSRSAAYIYTSFRPGG